MDGSAPDPELLKAALANASPELIEALVKHANPELLQHLQQVAAGAQPQGPSAASTADAPPRAEVGAHIGSYRLLQELGEGGMGTVFLAEQQHPVERRVALKIIKAGMDSRQVLARFEAEEQALAMMDHPNIAKVFDAGVTQASRPYFVMELVRGIPITQYCDQEHLTPRERLELFIPVCQAVQHAHQKGIIHRDLKPSNVIVALYDGKPVPKVIDFGVAKATGAKLTERTMFTEVGQMVGTLEYMAPEQAELNNLDIDTRADIYSLGVLLYELLTGSPPFSGKELRSAALSEMLRVIREVEPAKPSTRISSLGATATTTAVHRGTDVNALTKALRGDVDWIVMKALEKNRSRRYETANALADDLSRYLHGDPIAARPPSTTYRLRKAASRHRVALTAGTIVALTLVAATITSSWLAIRARRSLEKAQNILFDKVLMYALSGDVDLTELALRDAANVNLDPAWQEFAVAVAHTWNGEHDEARAYYERARQYDHQSYAIQASEIQVLNTDRDFYPKVLALRDREPSGPFDSVFQVQTEAWYTPSKALEALDKCGEWKDSTLAQYFGAIAHANHALLHQNLDEAEDSIDAFEKLLRWYPGNKLPLCGLLYNSLAARNIAIQQGETELAGNHERAARHWAEALAIADPTNVFWATRSRAWFFAECGEGSRALEEWQKRMGREPLGIDPMHYAACCCLFGDESIRGKAISTLPDAFDVKNAHAHLAKAYLLALSQSTQDEVSSACQGLSALNDPRREMQCGTVEVWLVYGDLGRAREAAGRLLRTKDQSPEWNKHWDLFLEYVIGQREDDEFIQAFEATDPPMFQAKAEYLAGLKAFAEGRTEPARRYFRKCCDTGRVFASWYWWSKVLLQRLEQPQSDDKTSMRKRAEEKTSTSPQS